MNELRKFYEQIIRQGNFRIEDMRQRIFRAHACGGLADDDLSELLTMADEQADDRYQIDLVAKLADLEARIAVLESAGVVVWKSGMSVAKGQTVLYDIEKNGVMRYCRYDGGRSATTLSPGKINGWVILESANGAVTHTVEKDENGNIILVPVAETPQE